MDASSLTVTTCLLTGTVLLICTCILRLYKHAFSYWKKRGVDCVQPTIPFGNAYNLYTGKCTFGDLFAQLYLQLKERGFKHGGMYFFWKPVYIPVDPEIIKHILIRDFDNFSDHGLFISDDDPLSKHIFNMEGTEWRNLRAKMPAAFTTSKMRKMFLIMESMTGRLVQNLNAYAESGKSVNIKNELSRFTTDIITSSAFGIESHTLKYENEEVLEQGRYFFDYQWSLYKNTMVMLVPRHILQKFGFRIMPKSLENLFKNMAEKILSLRKQEGTKRDDLMDILIRLTEKHENERDFSGKNLIKPLDFGELTAQMCVFFSAGFETSSSTQSFALYELAKNPDCQTKLRQEINVVLKKYDNNLTYDAVLEMEYLEQVVNETLRLYPIFPILPRKTNKDYKIPGTDTTIEKDTMVLVSNMGLQRDPEYYHNPEIFDPEHFSKENISTRPFVSNIPFGEGPRICVGKRFGLFQTKVGIIALLRNYDISISEKYNTPFKFVYNELILRKTGDIWLDLKKIHGE